MTVRVNPAGGGQPRAPGEEAIAIDDDRLAIHIYTPDVRDS